MSSRPSVEPIERAADDYVMALDHTRSVADYFVVNVSSPNTPGLRDLQTKAYLEELLGRVCAAAAGTPVLVKLSPDLEPKQLADAVAACQSAHAAGIVSSRSRPAPANAAPRPILKSR